MSVGDYLNLVYALPQTRIYVQAQQARAWGEEFLGVLGAQNFWIFLCKSTFLVKENSELYEIFRFFYLKRAEKIFLEIYFLIFIKFCGIHKLFW
jgi:hypothetical protein